MLGVVAILICLQIYMISRFESSESFTNHSFLHKNLKPPKFPMQDDGNTTLAKRRVLIRKAMHHAWSNYEKYAFGADEIGPVSGKPKHDVWGGLGVTLVDSLDTLFIMNMQDEFFRARSWVAHEMDFSHLGKNGDVISVFEIIIRQLGGLLSAYDLSQDNIFKARATELADLLLPAYGNEVFYTKFNVYTKFKTMNHWTGNRAFLADVGTLQLEMRYLSDITGNPEYAQKGDAFYEAVRREGSYNGTGLFPVHFSQKSGRFSQQDSFVTIGALGDSFYEYLLKVWIYSGKRQEDQFLRDAYDAAVDGIEKYLLIYSPSDDAYYLQELHIPEMKGKPQQDHLLCFVPGMLALGTIGETNASKVTQHLNLAKKLMQTCVNYYLRQPTGLSPDLIQFPGFQVENAVYKLRPETVESLMYMYRVTKDPIFREWGWTIFEALEKYAKITYGYGTVHHVDDLKTYYIEDKMESFFLAETLKYHYMLQSPSSFLPLDKYVFNTEAHPFSIRESQ
ncbi:hypothetical protein LEN26_020656 [Aphanomyces euteiches]|nr:hypothetical protein LEN26_020656 [Aphanomyces euteiches]KAH9105075.1 hypothetical protein AeMF1_019001 [Aphanomyces euteiches]KAH9193364.1 hypothetical protein AeNC1_004657 [Aphanomyces euteiches]